MGEVYRATDTKLKRDVALKILPETFAQDPQRMGRFQREAEVLASLNHPNIAGIHGLEQEGSTHAIAMELVEGETLAARISKGAIPLEEALKIALQITTALEAAHEKGIIHRDLKPANVIVTPEGTAKVLDFGLAKAMEPASSSEADLSQSPTLTMQATQAGIIMGTAAYMSPEQAKGLIADQRSDIWSFGAVVFEMLSGNKPFIGDDITEVLASVVKVEVDWDDLPSGAPATVQRWLRRCLTADPKQRWEAISDIRISIEEYFDDPDADSAASVQASVPSWSLPLSWITAVGVLVLAVLATWYLKPVPEPPLFKTTMIGDQLQQSPAPPVISPDGNVILYRVGDSLSIRYFNRFDSNPLADSDNVRYPFFSPDSQYIAYSQDDKLWKVNTSTPAPNPRSVTHLVALAGEPGGQTAPLFLETSKADCTRSPIRAVTLNSSSNATREKLGSLAPTSCQRRRESSLAPPDPFRTPSTCWSTATEPLSFLRKMRSSKDPSILFPGILSTGELAPTQACSQSLFLSLLLRSAALLFSSTAMAVGPPCLKVKDSFTGGAPPETSTSWFR